MNIDFQIDETFTNVVPTHLLEKAVRQTVQLSSPSLITHSTLLTIVVTDNEAIQKLNKTYRGVDAPTDVLSFVNEPDDEFIFQDSSDSDSIPEETYLGDIIIAYPFAEAQSQAAGHTTSDELILLAVHGTLHLLGFDHDTPTNKSEMWAIQHQVMSALGLVHVEPTQ
jgi:probable rRNA maturation factor